MRKMGEKSIRLYICLLRDQEKLNSLVHDLENGVITDAEIPDLKASMVEAQRIELAIEQTLRTFEGLR